MRSMENLLTEIENALSRHENRISATSFGEKAMGDRHLVRQLREGRELRSKTVAKVRAFIQSLDDDPDPTESPPA